MINHIDVDNKCNDCTRKREWTTPFDLVLIEISVNFIGCHLKKNNNKKHSLAFYFHNTVVWVEQREQMKIKYKNQATKYCVYCVAITHISMQIKTTDAREREKKMSRKKRGQNHSLFWISKHTAHMPFVTHGLVCSIGAARRSLLIAK